MKNMTSILNTQELVKHYGSGEGVVKAVDHTSLEAVSYTHLKREKRKEPKRHSSMYPLPTARQSGFIRGWDLKKLILTGIVCIRYKCCLLYTSRCV